ncbi:MAG TPA: hypothetical protein VGX72_08915 [Solirubrobacteraceae bacterium]|jgi:hypothetical protein|nr:hypothetical protein [Solirubrobacteraceae bacterium]
MLVSINDLWETCMLRAAAVRRSVIGVTFSLCVVALVLAAAALAVKPARSAHFSGHMSTQPILGFRAPVKFTVATDGRTLKGFSFGTFGCFGAGGFRPGVNPYTGNSIMPVSGIKVSSSGRFSVAGAKNTSSSHGETTTTTISVSGRFTKAKAATGSVTFSQKITGTFSSTCGPATVGFTAAAQ